MLQIVFVIVMEVTEYFQFATRRSLLLELGLSFLFFPPDHPEFAAHQRYALRGYSRSLLYWMTFNPIQPKV